jgi:hypothetical protein
MKKPDHIPAMASGAQAPVTVQAQFEALLDCGPAWPAGITFPEGCDLWIHLPGSLVPAGKVPLPKGCMVFYLNPEVADQLRPYLRQQVEQQRALADRLAKESGRNGSLPGRG